MKIKILAIWLTAILAITPFVSGEYHPYAQENPVQIHAGDFTVAINTESPGVEFQSNNGTQPFSVQYLYVYAYSDNISMPVYVADLSKSSWLHHVNRSEEDGTTRIFVEMSAPLLMQDTQNTSFVWGKMNIYLLILVNGGEAQLSISVKMRDLTPISGVSHIALVQKISPDVHIDRGEIHVSGVFYRWPSKVKIRENSVERDADVSYGMMDGELYLSYPYSEDVKELYSEDLGAYAVIKDITGEIFGYGLGILLGSILLGIPYASHRKRKKSPFDMDSPLYRK